MNPFSLFLTTPSPSQVASITIRHGVRLVLAGLLVLLLNGPDGLALQAAAPSPAPPANLETLRGWFVQHLGQERFRHARWGVRVVSLDSGREVFAHAGDQLFVPASNTKLFTGALALDRLGPEFRIRTSLLAGESIDARGVLAGDLVVYGRGDPTFAARHHHGSLMEALEPVVAAVRQAGVRRVRGGLVMDATFFDGPTLGSGWEWDDLQFDYGAEVSSLTLNDNTIDLIVRPGAVAGQPARVSLDPAVGFMAVSNLCVTAPAGVTRDVRFERPVDRNVIYVTGQIPAGGGAWVETVAVHDPAAWYGEILRECLAQRGVTVEGPIRTRLPSPGQPGGAPGASLRELGAVESPPLRDLLGRMLKPSQNLYAQLLLLQVGAAEQARTRTNGVATALPVTTEAAGIEALNRFLAGAGIGRDEAIFEEGSGLTRRNLVTPAAIVRLLQHMDRHPQAAVFREALPVAGTDGTLRNRMKGTAAAGNARAKTGGLSMVATLSGYVTSKAGERFAFALMLNNYRSPDPSRPMRVELDDIVVTLAGLDWKTAAGNQSAP